MGYVIPAWELEIADVQAIRQKVVDALFNVSVRLTGLTREELVVRNALPKTDFGLTNEYWLTPTLTANAWSNYFTKELEKQRFAAFYGVANQAADPQVTGLKFKIGPGDGVKTIDVVQLEDMYTYKELCDGFFKKPIIYKETQYINIDAYAKSAVSEPLTLKCLICEPAGKITY